MSGRDRAKPRPAWVLRAEHRRGEHEGDPTPTCPSCMEEAMGL